MNSKKILIVMGHPSKKSLNNAIADSYEKSAKKSGFDVKRINICELKFDLVLHEGYKKIQKLEKDLVESQKLIKWAEHIVFVYPVWWGSVPALFKGWIDRVFLPGFAYKFDKPGIFPQKRFMKGKTVRVITTAGGPKWIYMLTMNPPYMMFKFYFLMFCGFKSRSTNFCGVSDVSKQRAEKIFEKARKLGLRGK